MRIKKVGIFYLREIKYLLRDNSLRISFLTPILITVLSLWTGGGKRLIFGFNIFHLLIMILLLDAEIYTNQFSSIKEEFRIYLLFPFSRLSLIISKNLFSLSFVLLQFIIISSGLLVLGLFEIRIFVKAIIYFVLTFPLLMGFGNLISIYFPRGFIEDRKRQPFFSSFFLPVLSLIISSILYSIFSIVNSMINNPYKLFLIFPFVILSLGIYYSLLKCSVDLVWKKRFYILNRL
ncbi:MAG: hypothetical protein GQ536_07730 [Candidatus Aminicenantes bacterium]|nr:hypothetical protein [Candidatus Aminicenantes bacterium]